MGKTIATFAGGCFWCMVPPFKKVKGVKGVISGYTGGNKENPSYEEVCSGKTGHLEAVQVVYDPKQVSYEKLLEIYWKQIDPTDDKGQFTDKGNQYRTAIFYHSEEQRKSAEKFKKEIQKKFDKPIATEIIKFTKFYPAEGYHQDYYKKNPIRYKLYKAASGRESYLKKAWKNEN